MSITVSEVIADTLIKAGVKIMGSRLAFCLSTIFTLKVE